MVLTPPASLFPRPLAHLLLPARPHTPPQSAGAAVQVVLALAAAVISVQLFAPALRFVQAYWLQASGWGRCGPQAAACGLQLMLFVGSPD